MKPNSPCKEKFPQAHDVYKTPLDLYEAQHPRSRSAAASAQEIAADLSTAATISKKQLKKEARKAEKAAHRQQHQQQTPAAIDAAEEDPFVANYGEIEVQSNSISGRSWTDVGKLGEGDDATLGCTVLVRGFLEAIRPVGKNMVFFVLRQSMSSVQCVLVANSDAGVSRQMVRFAAAISKESVVDVEGVVSLPKEPLKATTQQDGVPFDTHPAVPARLPQPPREKAEGRPTSAARRDDVEHAGTRDDERNVSCGRLGDSNIREDRMNDDRGKRSVFRGRLGHHNSCNNDKEHDVDPSKTDRKKGAKRSYPDDHPNIKWQPHRRDHDEDDRDRSGRGHNYNRKAQPEHRRSTSTYRSRERQYDHRGSAHNGAHLPAPETLRATNNEELHALFRRQASLLRIEIQDILHTRNQINSMVSPMIEVVQEIRKEQESWKEKAADYIAKAVSCVDRLLVRPTTSTTLVHGEGNAAWSASWLNNQQRATTQDVEVAMNDLQLRLDNASQHQEASCPNKPPIPFSSIPEQTEQPFHPEQTVAISNQPTQNGEAILGTQNNEPDQASPASHRSSDEQDEPQLSDTFSTDERVNFSHVSSPITSSYLFLYFKHISIFNSRSST
ncbi:hypothetical protein PR202_ga12260 [Eleusine coracana subsp. coracana]|uniref:Uncharacterized protein n=1 Tax=Eleusine coracana subsp. coracana TaxID=191504 RepID=A0AAV5CB17_ELECO|nr:hypothetical protein PR202_ga12260 [Eleusine coracana subsp. coracana]